MFIIDRLFFISFGYQEITVCYSEKHASASRLKGIIDVWFYYWINLLGWLKGSFSLFYKILTQ